MMRRGGPRSPTAVAVTAAQAPSTTPARTRRARDLGQSNIAWATRILTFLLAVGLGLVAAFEPGAAIALLVGVMVIFVVVTNVTVGLLVLVTVAYLESLPSISGGPSLSKIVGIFLVLGWLAALTAGRGEERTGRDLFAQNHLLVWTLGLFVAWSMFSLLWAEDIVLGKEVLLRFALNVLLFPIVFAAIREVRHVIWLYTAMVAGGLATVTIGFLLTTGTTEGRLYGAGLNPNELGGLTAVATVLAAVLACNRSLSLPARVASVCASGLCAIFMTLTGSRGAVVGITAALLVTPFVAGRGRRLTAAGLVAIGAAALVTWLFVFAPPQTTARLREVGSSGSGRADLWAISMRMVEAHPLTGVGVGNFPVSSVHYLLEPGVIMKDEYIVDRPQQTHNIYLQVVAELGIVGLTMFLGIIAICLVCAARAAALFRRAGNVDAELLARGLLIALVALLVTDAFTTNIYSKQLYVLLATGPALLAISRRGLTSPG
jgi:O-antigen ligase